MTTVGFLGAGAMGGGMVRRLLQHDHRVIVWSRTPAKHGALAKLGAELNDSITATTEQCDMVVGCLRDTDVTRECYLGAQGVLAAARPRQIIVEHGTFDPALAVEIAAAADARGCHFLDAPVSGGPEGAVGGQLVTMVGGSAPAVEKARPVLAAYSRMIVRVGGPGAGEQLKLINQLLVSLHIVAAAQASALVIRTGVDAFVARDVLMAGWGASTILGRSLPRAVAGEFERSGATVGKLIEVQPLIDELLRSCDVDTTLFSHVRDQFDATAAAVGEDLDIAALVTRYLPATQVS